MKIFDANNSNASHTLQTEKIGLMIRIILMKSLLESKLHQTQYFFLFYFDQKKNYLKFVKILMLALMIDFDEKLRPALIKNNTCQYTS